MNNVSYCTVVMDMLRNRSTLGNKMKDWLLKCVVDYDPLETIPELLLQVDQYKIQED
jgi:hypothetical protein